jgi:hypothetical protein
MFKRIICDSEEKMTHLYYISERNIRRGTKICRKIEAELSLLYSKFDLNRTIHNRDIHFNFFQLKRLKEITHIYVCEEGQTSKRGFCMDVRPC